MQEKEEQNSKVNNINQDNLHISKNRKKIKFKMLSAFTILLLIIFAIILISWVLKWSGTTTEVNNVPTKIKALGIFDVFLAPMKGFVQKADIIIFILTLGAFINVLMSTKSLEGFSQAITSKLKGKEVWAIIPLMLFFSFCGTTEGMAEESLGFYMICIPLMMAAGFDKITGLFIVLVGAGVGVIASTVNPFCISVAVNALTSTKQITTSVGDGIGLRLISWVVLTSIAIIMVMLYARKVKLDPQKSYTFATMEGDKKFFLSESVEIIDMNWRRKLSIVVFGFVFLIMILYMVGWDSILGYKDVDGDPLTYGPSMRLQNFVIDKLPYLSGMAEGFGIGGLDTAAAFFLIGSIALAIINCYKESTLLKEFMTGAGDILSVCLIIATAGGVGVVLQNSHIQELVIIGLSNSIGGIGSSIGIIIILFIIFILLSFVIPSTSGFATAVFPLLTGIVAKDSSILASGSITAFSFASGLVNIITPTSGVVMGAIAYARIDYAMFLNSIWKIILALTVACFILLLIGGAIGKPII
ncbi:YfcC family protein [Spiroplasma endosymbiont of Aspidapion aeneum]|uniref:YfcC family protein n=1 Tax=Spiroplasma endosymbiont of Aspidapion aeneum TaxID=3066276 RepID=UPI00313D2D60